MELEWPPVWDVYWAIVFAATVTINSLSLTCFNSIFSELN